MQEKHLFEYAVIRIVPRVEREEFMNVGVVLLCKKLNFLGVKYLLDAERLQAFCPKLDVEQVQAYLDGFEKICNGTASGSSIAQLSTADRFRWLTANRSTVLQTSKVHPGFCDDPAVKTEQLFNELVAG